MEDDFQAVSSGRLSGSFLDGKCYGRGNLKRFRRAGWGRLLSVRHTGSPPMENAAFVFLGCRDLFWIVCLYEGSAEEEKTAGGSC